MKKLSLITAILVALALLLSCKKQAGANCSLTHAKVLRYDCDRVILQLLDGSFNGDASWTDMVSGNTYTNVVSYYNTCAFSQVTNNELTEVYIEGITAVDQQQLSIACMQCQALSQAPPQTKIDMAGFRLTPCEDNE